MQRKTTLTQLIKYGVVGVMNTLITAVIIWVLRRVGWSEITSNLVGYIAGVINSFIWNRQWTFGSNRQWHRDLILFFLAFGICYLIQLGGVLLLNAHTDYDPYYNHLIGIVIYSLLNFLFNKFITFGKSKQKLENKHL